MTLCRPNAMAPPFLLRRKARFDAKATRLSTRVRAHVARMFGGRPRSLPVQGVSVPSPGRARPGARPGPRDGGGRRSSRRRIALRRRLQRGERQNEGDADRGEDRFEHGYCLQVVCLGRRRRRQGYAAHLYHVAVQSALSPRTRRPTPASIPRDWLRDDDLDAVLETQCARQIVRRDRRRVGGGLDRGEA